MKSQSQFKAPPVGSVVTLTTSYADYYYRAEKPTRETTYENVEVLEPERWFKPGDIKITSDDPRQLYRVVNMRNVVALSDGIRDNSVASSFTMRVEGSKGASYTVAVTDGTPVTCTCKGFQFRQTCRHLSVVSDTLAEQEADPKGEEPKTVHREEIDMSNTTLSWNDRLALINHFKPSDGAICAAFGVTQDELETARSMADAGTFTPTPDLDVKSYANLFANADDGAEAPTGEGDSTVQVTEGSTSTTPKKRERKSRATSTKRATGKPETATKPTKTPKKRGRKGSNIATAYAKIPTKPTDVAAFATKHGVSVNVLRQSKRFDKCPEKGQVHVKKDKDSGTLMIWREKPAKS